MESSDPRDTGSEPKTARTVPSEQGERELRRSLLAEADGPGSVESSRETAGTGSGWRGDVSSSYEDSPAETRKKRPSQKRVKRPESTWYIFDNLTVPQSEDLLRQHGANATYLVSHFHDPQSYQFHIRFDEDEDLLFKHYSISISNKELHVEGLPGRYKTIEDVAEAIQRQLSVQLQPIFHQYNCDTCDYSVTISDDSPPDYVPAQKFPEAPKKRLPVIVPIRPTLRRMMTGERIGESSSGGTSTSAAQDQAERGCCWKAFHTDPAGHWYKPHKAGPVMAVLLIIGWVLFLVLFGWVVALALILILVLVMCAYTLNFICTGRCSIDDEDDP